MENFILGNPSRSSNPGPSAPLGPAPAPRAPRGLPPLSALPLTPAPPGSLCSGSVAGSGDVATQPRLLLTRCSTLEALLIAGRLAGRQSRSSAFVALAPPAASPWRRAAASRRTARRSLAACPRIRGTGCRRASTWPCARSWGAIRGGATRTWTIAADRFSSLWFTLSLFSAIKNLTLLVHGNPSRIRTPDLLHLSARPPPRAPLVGSLR